MDPPIHACVVILVSKRTLQDAVSNINKNKYKDMQIPFDLYPSEYSTKTRNVQTDTFYCLS